MKPASFYASYAVKTLWSLVAALLVVVAVSISVLRYSLPYLEGQKDRVENWLSEQYGVELSIGELSAGWAGIGPSLILRDVELRQSEQSPIGLSVLETQVELNFWGTIRSRQIQSRRFELSGLSLSVDLPRIQGAESEFPIVDALQSLFLEQLQQFSVKDSLINVTTLHDQQLIQVESLSWVNKGDRHQGRGLLRVVELARNSAEFTLDLFGDKDSLDGTFFAKGEELDFSPWLNEISAENRQLTESRANFTFWADISNSAVTGVEMALDASEFAWQINDVEVALDVVGGELRAQPNDVGWKLSLDNLTLETDKGSLVTGWSGQVFRNGALRISNTRTAQIDAILPLLPLFIEDQDITMLGHLNPTARIDKFNLQIDNQVAAHIEFSRLGWQQVDLLPGLDNLSGQLDWYGNEGALKLIGVAGDLQIDNLLDNNVAFQEFSVAAHLSVLASGVQLYVPSVEIDSEQIKLVSSISYDSETGLLGIASDIDSLAMDQVKALFPTELMGRDTRKYLMRALEEGNVKQAKLLWFGNPSSYPYEDDEGVFQALVELNDVKMSFDPGWPSLTELQIDLMFENEGLSMHARSGKLMDVQLSDLHAVIPELAERATLTIDAVGAATGEQVTALMLESNLADSVGKVLSRNVQISKPLEAALNLEIPLTGRDVVATGKVALAGNPIHVANLGLTFDNAKGEVNFVNEYVTFDGLEAELLAQPVALTFSGDSDANKHYVADIRVAGNWQVAPLLSSYHPALMPFLQGQGDWALDVDLTIMADDIDYQATLVSELEGLVSDLPVPFRKQAQDSLPLRVVSKGNQQVSSITASLGEQVSFEGVLPHKEYSFSRAHLAIGESDMLGLGLGFSISANLPQMGVIEWYDAISAIVRDLPKTGKPALLSVPERIYVDVQEVVFAGSKVNNLELVAKYTEDYWLLDLDSEQAKAEVRLHKDWYVDGIDINADFIELSEWQSTDSSGKAATNFADLPPINFNCKRCSAFDINLGRVDMELARSEKGMTINRLDVMNDHGEIKATGDWFVSDTGNSTRLVGDMTSSDFGALLKEFGFDSGIKDSKANMAFDLSWQGSPQGFNFDSLNGDVKWGLTDGYLSSLTDKGARIFSILSLQSLVRKLSLDFRDVFAKGFFYDKMDGSFQLSQGRAYTSDTVIDGGAGEMTIAGYSDLSSKELNYQIGFTPNVTSSLPLLVYWMVNPATAIAALAIDQVLTEAKVISHVRYSLTGTFDEPVATQIDARSEDVALPAQYRPPPTSDPVDPTSSLPSTDAVSELSDG